MSHTISRLAGPLRFVGASGGGSNHDLQLSQSKHRHRWPPLHVGVSRTDHSMSVLEVCIDSVAGARAAASAGSHRVELCSDLVEGGVTPSYGLIKQVKLALQGSSSNSTLHSSTAPGLMVLIRPRGGDFVYTEDEIAVMLADIAVCKQLGADGVVIGCLEPDGQVDAASTGVLLQAARQHGLDVTFHRAFDVTRNLSEALEVLINLGVPRVLTSGGQPSAEQGAAVLNKLVKQAAGCIRVMAGGGVTAGNAAAILAETGVRELHSSAKAKHYSVMQYRSPHLSMSSCSAPSDYEWNCTSQDEVVRLLSIITGQAQGQATHPD